MREPEKPATAPIVKAFGTSAFVGVWLNLLLSCTLQRNAGELRNSSARISLKN
jgi:hypothetical protein